jgi:hypothetical protein
VRGAATSQLLCRVCVRQVGTASAALIARANVLNKRTLDIFGGRAWSTLSLACEKLGTLASIRKCVSVFACVSGVCGVYGCVSNPSLPF